MTYSIRLPDGSLVENIPDEVTPEAAKAKLLTLYPELAAAPKPVSAPSKDISFGEAATNVGGALIGGVGKTIQLPGQLYGLATGDFAETGSLGLGKKIEKFGEEMKSEGFKARKQERAAKIAEAEKEGQASAFGTAFGETVKDPALLVDFLAETVPQLLVPFGIGRATAAATGARQLAKGAAATEAAKVAGRVGTSAAVGTGAVQQGADVGAGSYEAIYKELLSKGVSEADAKESALNLARASGASGALISLLAQKLPGARRLEEAMAGVPSKAGRIRGALGTAAGETLGEIPEEVGGKFTQNLAMREVKPEQELTAGLGEAAAMAAIGGIGLGGAAGLARGKAKPEAPPEPPKEPSSSPVVATQVVNVDGKEATKITRQDGSVEVDGVQIVPPTTMEPERETTQTTPTTKGEEDVARPNEPTSGTGVPVPVRAADELPTTEGIEGTEQRGVDGAGPTLTEPAGGAGVQPTPVAAIKPEDKTAEMAFPNIEKFSNIQPATTEEPETFGKGPEYISQKLSEAKDKGELSNEAVDFAEWFIKRNPKLVDSLEVSVKDPTQAGVAGSYLPITRIMELVKNSNSNDTAVHEILHHLERAMPPDAQSSIKSAWLGEIKNAEQKASTQEEKDFFGLLNKFHFSGRGKRSDFNSAVQMIKNGDVPYEYYQYVNPSEFWTVNGTEIMKGRFKAMQGGSLARLKNWTQELSKKINAKFGSDASGDIISALDSLSKGDGKFQSNKMLYRSGEYAPTRKNVYGEINPATWLNLEKTKISDVIYALKDKNVDTKDVIAAIEASSKKIDEKWNPYLKEELFHGRSATQIKNFNQKYVVPLLKFLQSKEISILDFDEYLHNRHAEERNIQNAKINPDMPDGGSGIYTEDAKKYLANLDRQPKLKKDFESAAKMLDKITSDTRKLLVDSGLETKNTINAWEKTYDYYVPLKREDIDYASGSSGTGAGQGFSVKGPSSKRAIGSSANVVDILANVVMQGERAILKAEKDRVAVAVYGLVLQNPNSDFWLAVDPYAKGDIKKSIKDLISMGINPVDAKNIMEEPVQKYIDPQTGLAVERINPALRNNDNVLAVRINGEDKFVFFNPRNERAMRMVSSLKNLDADQLGRVLGFFSKFTRYFASINTQYNPIFGAYNFIRDAESAMLQLSTTEIAGKEKEVLKNALPALKGIYSALRAQRSGKEASGEWESLWKDFTEQGGQTGFRDQFSKSEERNKALQEEIKKISEGKVKKAGRAIFDWLSDYNETMENAIRLSAYKAAIDNDLSKEKAASIAKNISVNFNRKGQIGVQANALYAFFNAAVQGTARLVETLRGPLGKKIIGGGLLLGSMQAMLLALAGFEDDEPPDFIKEKNLVIPLFVVEGKYIAIPMPLGYNVIPNTSRVLTEWAMSGFKKTDKRLEAILGSYMDAFNPIGNAGWSLQTIFPTIFDPIVALAENKDWTGKTIAKKDLNSLDPTPGYTRAKDTASFFGKQLSEFLNWSTGGTKYAPGLLSPTPDQIDYLIGQATGGVGRELLKAQQTVSSVITGEELPEHKIPLAGRFYGNVKSGASQANKFYENIKEINIHENEVKGRRENRENVSEYLKEHPEARLADRAKEAQRNIANLKKRKAALIEKDAPKESVTAIENQITRQMQRFNEAVERAQR